MDIIEDDRNYWVSEWEWWNNNGLNWQIKEFKYC